MTNIPTNTLIVVGTGEGASFYRNRGDVQNIKLERTNTLEPGDLADQGPSGKSPPEQSPQESMEATFSKTLAEHLYNIAYGKKAEHIVLILDPDTMGEVRPLLHKEVTDRVILEQTKTLVNNPVEDIEKSLAAA